MCFNYLYVYVCVHGVLVRNFISIFINRIQHSDGEREYLVVSGPVDVPSDNKVLAVTIVMRKIDPTLKVSIYIFNYLIS